MNKIEIPKEIFENIFFAEGGTKKEVAKELAGNYQAPLTQDRLHLANAEVEKNEYVFDSNGIRKFGGSTHENGGTPVKLEDGSKILSDHLKIGSDLAKELTKSLKLPFRATDTYAKALDRYSKSSGLPKVNKEIEDLILKMNSLKKEDKSTFELNNQFINNSINSKNKEKEPLEKEMESFFNMLFQKQESSKKEQSGSKMQMGGSYMEIASQYGVSPERAKEILKDLPHYQDAKAEYPEEEPKVKPQPSTLPWNEQNNPFFALHPGREGKLQDWTNEQTFSPDYNLGDLKSETKRFKELADNAGFKYSDSDFKTQKDLNNFAGKLQEHIVNTKPELAYHYGLNVEPTRQGLQYLVDNKIIKPEDYGIKVVNGKVSRGSYGTLSSDAQKNLNKVIQQLPEDSKKTYALTNYKDNLGYFRGIKTKDQELMDEEYKRFTKENEPVGAGYYKTNVPGAYVKPILIGEQAPESTPTGEVRFAETPFNYKPSVGSKTEVVDEGRGRRGLLLLPDQTPMTPSSLLPSLKIKRRFSRLDYNDVSPEQQLSEMARTQVAAQDQLKDLSPEQRAASAIGMVANNSALANKVISETNRANAAGRNSVDAYNAKISDAEENAAGQDALDYERRTYTGIGNQEKEWHNFYDRLAQNQMNNWKHVEALNKYNALNPDVQFTGNGYEVNNNPGFGDSARQYLADLYKEDKVARAKTKKATAKFGGRFKK